MAQLVLDNPYVNINSVDLTAYVRSVTLNLSANIMENTASGATAIGRIAGLKDNSLAVTFNQDFASAKVDATIAPLVGAAAFPIIVKPDGSATAVTNPKWTGNAVLETYPVMAGTVGDNYEVPVTFLCDGAWTRATSD